jgi:hypothetical protein
LRSCAGGVPGKEAERMDDALAEGETGDGMKQPK